MEQKEFVLDLIINELAVKDASIQDAEQLVAKFTFGDLKLDITTGRVNVVDFEEGRSIEFLSTLEDLKIKLESTPLELTLLKPDDEKSEWTNEMDTWPEIGDAETKRAHDVKNQGENKEDETSHVGSDESKGVHRNEERNANQNNHTYIGKVSVKWPAVLIQKLTDHCTAVVPYIQVCDIVHKDEVAGTLTLAIMFHSKREQRPLSADSSQPYINELGILSAFQEARKEMEKNDVFFIFGQNPDPFADSNFHFEKSSPCEATQRYPIHLETSKYDLIRGIPVEKCTPIFEDTCDEQDCYIPWYHPEKQSKKKRLSPMEEMSLLIFKERYGSRGSKKRTRFSRSYAARRNGLTKSRSTGKQSEPGTPRNLQQILIDKLEMYQYELEAISNGPDRENILLPRLKYCSEYCESLGLYPRLAPCTKCGYKPPFKFIHNKGETINDIAY